MVMDSGAPGLGEVLTQFSFDVPWLAFLLGSAVIYGWGVRRAAAVRNPHPGWKVVSFYAGIVLLATATVSPLEHYGNQALWLNFTVFLVVTMISAPLIVASSPITLAFRASGSVGRGRLRTFYRGFPWTALTNPAFAWLVFAITTYIWQFSTLTEVAARHWWVRDIQLFSLLFVAVLFWFPALAADPIKRRLPHPIRALYVMLEMVHKGLFGGMFLSMNTPFHEQFSPNPPSWAPEAMLDQRMAILILWIGGNAFFLIALVTIVLGWSRYETRNQKRTDRRLAREREAERRRKAALDKVFGR